MSQKEELTRLASERIHTDAKCLNCVNSSCILLTGGLNNIIAKVCDPKFDCKPVVINVYSRDSQGRMDMQQKTISLARKIAGIPIQDLLELLVIDGEQPLGIVKKEYIEGETVAQALESGRLSSINMYQIMQDLGTIMARIHATQAPYFGKMTANGHNPLGWEEFFGSRFHKRIVNVNQCDPDLHMGRTSMTHVQNMISGLEKLVLEQQNSLSEITMPKLIHHDLHFLNVVTDGSHVNGVLDWENLTGGDPEFDIAFLEVQLFLNRRIIPGFSGVSAGFIDAYHNAGGEIKPTQRRTLYYADCALSYFEAIGWVPEADMSEQVKLYAEGQAAILEAITSGVGVNNIQILNT